MSRLDPLTRIRAPPQKLTAYSEDVTSAGQKAINRYAQAAERPHFRGALRKDCQSAQRPSGRHPTLRHHPIEEEIRLIRTENQRQDLRDDFLQRRVRRKTSQAAGRCAYRLWRRETI